MSVDSRPSVSTSGSGIVEAPLDPVRTPPVTIWAGVGAVLLALELYVLLKWVSGPDLARVHSGPDTPPVWMKVAMDIFQYGGCAAGAGMLYWFLVRPWRREHRVTTDGLMCIALMLASVYDASSNYVQRWFDYNSYFINFGNPARELPGWLSLEAPGHATAWPIVLVIPAYLWVCFSIAWAVSWMMGRLRSWWPRMSNLRLLVVTYVICFVVDVLLEGALFMRLGFWYDDGYPILGAHHYYEFPLLNGIFAAAMFLGFASIRFFKNDQGQTLAERGVDTIASPRRATAMRALALIGIVQVSAFATYHIPMMLTASVHAERLPPSVQSRSYLHSNTCWPAHFCVPGHG